MVDMTVTFDFESEQHRVKVGAVLGIALFLVGALLLLLYPLSGIHELTGIHDFLLLIGFVAVSLIGVCITIECAGIKRDFLKMVTIFNELRPGKVSVWKPGKVMSLWKNLAVVDINPIFVFYYSALPALCILVFLEKPVPTKPPKLTPIAIEQETDWESITIGDYAWYRFKASAVVPTANGNYVGGKAVVHELFFKSFKRTIFGFPCRPTADDIEYVLNYVSNDAMIGGGLDAGGMQDSFD